MDGAKSVTDTSDNRKVCGRQALCESKSSLERVSESRTNEDPGESRNRVM